MQGWWLQSAGPFGSLVLWFILPRTDEPWEIAVGYCELHNVWLHGSCFPLYGPLIRTNPYSPYTEYGVINWTNAFFPCDFQWMEDPGSNFLSLDGVSICLYDFLSNVFTPLTSTSLLPLGLETVMRWVKDLSSYWSFSQRRSTVCKCAWWCCVPCDWPSKFLIAENRANVSRLSSPAITLLIYGRQNNGLPEMSMPRPLEPGNAMLLSKRNLAGVIKVLDLEIGR